MILFNHPNAPKTSISTETIPYKVDEAISGTIYMCWESGATEQHLEKIVESAGVTTITFAFDTWANRGTATYVGYYEYRGV